MVPGIDRELVVSDCEVPTPELSLITSEAVSPRLLSKKKFTEQGWSVEISTFFFFFYGLLFRAANVMQTLYIYVYIYVYTFKRDVNIRWALLAQR